jgi:hypothetical protein
LKEDAMTRFATACALLAGILTAGCATMGIGSYGSPGASFTGDRTFTWGAADGLPTGDPRLDNNAIFRDHLEGAVEKALVVRGLRRAEKDSTADLLVHYHATITRRLTPSGIELNPTFCRPPTACPPRLEEYEVGTLVVDIVDARTNRLQWRGWAEDTIAGELEDQDLMNRRIDEAVERMMRRLPR